MRVTSKGQVTIPQTVRQRLGITPGSEADSNILLDLFTDDRTWVGWSDAHSRLDQPMTWPPRSPVCADG